MSNLSLSDSDMFLLLLCSKCTTSPKLVFGRGCACSALDIAGRAYDAPQTH